VFINSGSAANELTMLALKYLYGEGEIIVPPLTWVSDVNSVLFSGHKLVFCDINLQNLSFDLDKLEKLITDKTRAIFLTHVLGINGLTDRLLALCKEKNILLIEDVCESHGTTFRGQKVGSIGYASNFSFYFAHHMSTIEGGVVCTNDDKFYQIVRALRSHGMVRECTDEVFKQKIIKDNPILNKDFIFIGPAHNFRSTEINAVIGLNQIKRLDDNNLKRIDNFNYFINNLDSKKYITNFNTEGQCNYAFIVVLQEPSFILRDKIEATLRDTKVEFRRGLSGGGNQTLQPYISKTFEIDQNNLPNVNHVHHFGWYIGNYPTLERNKIDQLLHLLNNIE
jgi:CDP-6-deoxy-D-xylo-4-hexulose-3-dehydrase